MVRNILLVIRDDESHFPLYLIIVLWYDIDVHSLIFIRGWAVVGSRDFWNTRRPEHVKTHMELINVRGGVHGIWPCCACGGRRFVLFLLNVLPRARLVSTACTVSLRLTLSTRLHFCSSLSFSNDSLQLVVRFDDIKVYTFVLNL